MARDVFFKGDFENGIVAIAIAQLNTAVAYGGGNYMYNLCIVHTAQAQAALYGLSWPVVAMRIHDALDNPARELLLSVVDAQLLTAE